MDGPREPLPAVMGLVAVMSAVMVAGVGVVAVVVRVDIVGAVMGVIMNLCIWCSRTQAAVHARRKQEDAQVSLCCRRPRQHWHMHIRTQTQMCCKG